MLNTKVAHCLQEREKPPSLPIWNDRLLIYVEYESCTLLARERRLPD